MNDFLENWKRCRGVLILSVVMAILAIPFFVVFTVQFVEGKDEWIKNGRDIIPGDTLLYGGLVFVNFAWVFFVIYYNMTLTSKTYDDEPLETAKSLKKSESNLHMAPQTAVQNDAYDNAYDSSDDEMY